MNKVERYRRLLDAWNSGCIVIRDERSVHAAPSLVALAEFTKTGIIFVFEEWVL